MHLHRLQFFDNELFVPIFNSKCQHKQIFTLEITTIYKNVGILLFPAEKSCVFVKTIFDTDKLNPMKNTVMKLIKFSVYFRAAISVSDHLILAL